MKYRKQMRASPLARRNISHANSTDREKMLSAPSVGNTERLVTASEHVDVSQHPIEEIANDDQTMP